MRLLSMRMAIQFSVGAFTTSKRMQKEDEKLKRAVAKHYLKLLALERVRKYDAYKFSETVADLMQVLGFKKSSKYPDDLSR